MPPNAPPRLLGDVDASQYPTDKSALYLQYYDEHLAGLRSKDVRLLELGIAHGGSLDVWLDYFPKGRVVGLDMNPKPEPEDERAAVYQGMQQDPEVLDRIGREQAPEGFDVIIDDASHLGHLTEASFWHLFDNHLRPGGLYVIEDWRTAYWPTWPDGKRFRSRQPLNGGQKAADATLLGPTSQILPARLLQRWRPRRLRSHDQGMAGFIKRLVDEMAMDMVTHPKRGGGGVRLPRFKKVDVRPGQVFVVKADEATDRLVQAQADGLTNGLGGLA
ncbi:MAG: SAM-dependent methyltransferase [Thermoplasmatota archaeon]